VYALFVKICYGVIMRNYTKPEMFFGIIIIIISFVISVRFLSPAVANYIPVLSLWEDPDPYYKMGNLMIKDTTGNANILKSVLNVAFVVYVTLTIFFIINIFKKNFAINVLKIIFGYPWQPYYSFWLFWLIGFPIFLNIFFIIIDGLRYLIVTNFEISGFIPYIISIAIVWIGIQIIVGIITYLKKK
tara:strand:+ start:198 stop:758 length:561 start_codon:yes stop_codon:yes gene_type:complete